MDWFKQAVDALLVTQSSKPEAAPKAPVVSEPKAQDPEDTEAFVRQFLLDHPNANAASLYNALKNHGIVLVKNPEIETKKEADSASSNAQALRPEVKNPSRKESRPAPMGWRATLREASVASDGVGPTKFRVVLLQEGMGNFRDGFYYTKEALESAILAFNGKKIFADHPSSIEEETRPERSVRDVLGHFENLSVETADGGRSQLVGDVVILPDQPFEWARSLMRHSVDYAKRFPDQEFIGLSINASGDASESEVEKVLSDAPEACKPKVLEAKQNGIKTVRLVNIINEAVSCDLVTSAGAGGKVLSFLERNKEMQDEQQPHADEQQDIELIKKMIKDALGTQAPEGEEVTEAQAQEAQAMEKVAMQAYEGAMECGMKQDEAVQFAKQTAQVAKHMAQKQAKQTEGAPAPEPKDEEKSKEGEAEAESKEAAEVEGTEAHKQLESLKAENLALKGKLAFIENEKKKMEVQKYVETKLAESKLPRHLTKAFREAVGEIKSKEQFDKEFKIFTAHQSAQPEGLTFSFTEKASVSETKSASLDFSGCAR